MAFSAKVVPVSSTSRSMPCSSRVVRCKGSSANIWRYSRSFPGFVVASRRVNTPALLAEKECADIVSYGIPGVETLLRVVAQDVQVHSWQVLRWIDIVEAEPLPGWMPGHLLADRHPEPVEMASMPRSVRLP